MAHYGKYSRSAVGHLAKHYGREKDENGEYVKFGNLDIDQSRTPLNYNLAPTRHGGQIDFLDQRLSEVKVQNRKDVNVMGSWIVTLPTDKEYTDEEESLFFSNCYNFLAEKYGGDNVISAWVHRDESTPHLHFAFIPAVQDTRWNTKHPDKPREKVSSKECVTKAELKMFHPQLTDYLDTHTEQGLFKVQNGATVEGNKTKKELQEANIKELQAEIEALEKHKKKVMADIDKQKQALSVSQKLIDYQLETIPKLKQLLEEDEYYNQLVERQQRLSKARQRLNEPEKGKTKGISYSK